jgi:dipeptidyl aminopeptidase/acylaminoacyl peptidase
MRFHFAGLLAACLVLPAGTATAQAPARRPVRAEDVYHLRTVRDPQISPDGEWVAYVVSVTDSAKDKSNSDIWMAKWDGARNIRLTSSPDGESSPRWSPDNRYLAFVSGRGDDTTGAQVWLLDRTGGEAAKLTSLKGGVSEYVWSPDGKRLVVVSRDPDPDTTRTGEKKTPRPIVLDRYHFKQDVEGYLGKRRDHLYLVDVATGKAEPLTSGNYDESDPAWSADGTLIAFASNRTEDPDRNENSDIWVVEARPGATARQLTTSPGGETRPVWSPDGKWIAYSFSTDPRINIYGLRHLGIMAASGGASREIGAGLDRSIDTPVWYPDGTALLAGADDDRSGLLVRLNVQSGAIERLIEGQRAADAWTIAPGGRLAVLMSSPSQPGEIHALEGRQPRQLSHQNDAWLAEVTLATTEGIGTKARDGNLVNGLLVKPAGYVSGRRYPTLMLIHGGPVGQDDYSFSLPRQVFAASGYVILTANYRGSSGRGQAYQQAIYADWGNKEVIDVLAIVDEAVRLGVADPERLGIGGWSYGGITTNYTIASDTRFKAAMSGAGSSLQTSMYGSDQYVLQYDTELGQPWKNPEAWTKVSYPFWHADRIKTPTLFMVGEKDFNVPAVGSEQMFQALKSLGLETQLVIYPGQFHGITTPSYLVDRYRRWIGWYDRFLSKGSLVP